MAFFVSARSHARVDSSGAHFRSLRSARAWQRDKAIAHVKQVWELTLALEKRVQLPPVDLPGSWRRGALRGRPAILPGGCGPRTP